MSPKVAQLLSICCQICCQVRALVVTSHRAAAEIDGSNQALVHNHPSGDRSGHVKSVVNGPGIDTTFVPGRFHNHRTTLAGARGSCDRSASALAADQPRDRQRIRTKWRSVARTTRSLTT